MKDKYNLMKNNLKRFAMKNDWFEIMPNVYRDKKDNTIRLENFPEYCYYVYNKNMPRKKFFTVKQLNDFYKQV